MSELVLPIPDEWLDVIAKHVAKLLAERVPAAELKPYLSVDEAAHYAACTRQRIYDLRSSGQLSRHSDGRRALVARAELDAFLLPPDGGGGSGNRLAR
jgi:excisionase family DNA binding protein